MKTILIVCLLNLTNPSQASIVYQAFPSEAACEVAFQKLQEDRPVTPNINVSGFCVPASELN